VVAVREGSQSLETINHSFHGRTNRFPWMEVDKITMAGKILNVPARDQIPENIREQLIVELYSK
jgi:small subunit ribosomal protein S4